VKGNQTTKASALQQQVIDRIKHQQVEKVQSAVSEPAAKSMDRVMKEVLSKKAQQVKLQ